MNTIPTILNTSINPLMNRIDDINHNLAIPEPHETQDSPDTVSNLQARAEEQLTRLQKHETEIITLQSNLDILLKRYNAEKGHFSRVADWYGDTAWWLKILLGLIFVGIGAGIGAIFNIPIAIACTAAGVYLILAYLFLNHYYTSQKSHRRLCQDVIELEGSLGEAVKHFSELSASLKKVMISLCEMNTHMTDDLVILDNQLKELSEQLVTYNLIIEKLSETKDIIAENSLKINTELKGAEHLYQTCHQTLSENTSLLRQTNHDLSKISLALSDDQIELHLIYEKFHEKTIVISSHTQQMQLIFQALQTQVQEKQQQHQQLSQSIQATEQLTDDCEAVIAKAELSLQLAEKYLMTSSTMDLTKQDLEHEIDETIETNHAHLAKATALLQKYQTHGNIRTFQSMTHQ